MNPQNAHLDTLQDIKKMMERSSRFISLSGFSGIAAGSCALVGAWFANNTISQKDITTSNYYEQRNGSSNLTFNQIETELLYIGIVTFIAAFIFSFLFTYLRSKKTNTPIWGATAKRLMINVSIPIVIGGFFILKIIQTGTYCLVAPACLLFYGLALINASKFTLVEIRFLGMGQLLLGLLNLWLVGYGIYFWAFGFGILHIVYGIIMWYKYERKVD